MDMCKQLGREPDEDKIPPDWFDLPEFVRIAINVFSALGDRVYPDVGFTGKDYTKLPIYLDLYEIEDVDFFLDILSWLEARAIKKSADRIEREHKKLKSQSRAK